MITIGLTGSIGMGKSTAAKMIRLMGLPVHDSDKAVHAALMPGGDAYEKVIKLFPEALDPVSSFIDRQKLGSIVFQDKSALKKLEEILHPAARSSAVEFIQNAEALDKRAVALEIPLLFETGAESRVDYTICVTSPPDVQRQRVMKRPNMTEEKFKAILESQMPDAEKCAKSYFVVDTGRGYISTFLQLRKILKKAGAL
jgi:dephospho-CoA kinase